MHTAWSVQQFLLPTIMAVVPNLLTYVPLLSLLLSENEIAAMKVMFPECP